MSQKPQHFPASLENWNRIVIKIGSSLLVDAHTGLLREQWLDALGKDVATLRARGMQVIMVSSGSIALGRKILGLTPSKRLEENQAAAAAGQIELASAYRQKFSDYDIAVAQILLTYGDTEERRRYLNARNTINRLLELDVVPVINENDTVATDEMRYGDNDRLAARVASMCEADGLILLSDIDGLYSANPKTHKNADFIDEVSVITPEIEAMAGAPESTGFGTGGMVTKIAAGKIATSSGCSMIIINGVEQSPIRHYLEKGHGTFFHASTTPLSPKKKWIGAALEITGSLIIDQGAINALEDGKSLLPAGIIGVEGDFKRGDTVKIINRQGDIVGQGLVAYDAVNIGKLMGRKSHEIEQILGFSGRDEIIHRNDLVHSKV